MKIYTPLNSWVAFNTLTASLATVSLIDLGAKKERELCPMHNPRSFLIWCKGQKNNLFCSFTSIKANSTLGFRLSMCFSASIWKHSLSSVIAFTICRQSRSVLRLLSRSYLNELWYTLTNNRNRFEIILPWYILHWSMNECSYARILSSLIIRFCPPLEGTAM